jgi:hypothetical protein
VNNDLDPMIQYDVRCSFTGPDGNSFEWWFRVFAPDGEGAIREALGIFFSGLTHGEMQWAYNTLFVVAHIVCPVERERFIRQLRRVPEGGYS